jgi:hypothetical protein
MNNAERVADVFDQLGKMMPYDKSQIAKELTATALGESYFGNALYVARDIPCLTDDDRQVLSRWLDGSHATSSGSDRFLLQDIAIRISDDAKKDANINVIYKGKK